MDLPETTGRFAPSPTGYLHKGSLVTAVGSWLLSKRNNGRWMLRIDDLDRTRYRKEFEYDIIKTLERFHLFWDGEITRQSENIRYYEDAFGRLEKSRAVYQCCCSRTDIANSFRVNHSNDRAVYNGKCRNGTDRQNKRPAWRINTLQQTVSFTDIRHKHRVIRLTANDDVIIRRADGIFSYQFAVVIDDHSGGINQVVRGDDLLESTPVQIFLHQLLGFDIPQYCHLPLVTGENGTKLSKKDNAVSLSSLQQTSSANELLVWSLNFLGINVPDEIKQAPCGEILEWAKSEFKPDASEIQYVM